MVFVWGAAIGDWYDFTEIEEKKRGPALCNRLKSDSQKTHNYIHTKDIVSLM